MFTKEVHKHKNVFIFVFFIVLQSHGRIKCLKTANVKMSYIYCINFTIMFHI